MPKQAILFDIDGTLVDSNEAHVSAWCEAFRQHSYDFDRQEIHDQVGKGGDNLVPSLVPDAPRLVQQAIDQAHGEIYKRDYLTRVKPFLSARELLLKSKEAGKRIVLASSASRAELEHYIGLLDAAGIVDGATSKDDVRHSKPCPDIFAAALKEAGVRADEAVIVGDTPYDVTAGRRAGVETIAVRSGGFPEDWLSCEGPIAIYDSVSALLEDFDRSPICR